MGSSNYPMLVTSLPRISYLSFGVGMNSWCESFPGRLIDSERVKEKVKVWTSSSLISHYTMVLILKIGLFNLNDSWCMKSKISQVLKFKANDKSSSVLVWVLASLYKLRWTSHILLNEDDLGTITVCDCGDDGIVIADVDGGSWSR